MLRSLTEEIDKVSCTGVVLKYCVFVQVFFNVCDKQELMFHAVVLQANCCQNIIQVGEALSMMHAYMMLYNIMHANCVDTACLQMQGNNFGSCQDAIICQQGATANTACGNLFHVVKNKWQDQDGRNKFYPM